MSEETKKNRGRPKKEGSKADRFDLRLSPEEKKMLDDMVDNSDKSRSDHLRRALLFYYNAGYWRK